jgi:hypothetical protein
MIIILSAKSKKKHPKSKDKKKLIRYWSLLEGPDYAKEMVAHVQRPN